MDSLAGWIDQLKVRHRTMRKIAELANMSESGFVRGVKRGTLSPENLLRLAAATDMPPSTVLRMAGKGDLADLIERLYGNGQDALSESQRRVLEAWDRLPDADARANMLFTLRAIGNVAAHNKELVSSSKGRREARGSERSRGAASFRRP